MDRRRSRRPMSKAGTGQVSQRRVVVQSTASESRPIETLDVETPRASRRLRHEPLLPRSMDEARSAMPCRSRGRPSARQDPPGRIGRRKSGPTSPAHRRTPGRRCHSRRATDRELPNGRAKFHDTLARHQQRRARSERIEALSTIHGNEMGQVRQLIRRSTPAPGSRGCRSTAATTRCLPFPCPRAGARRGCSRSAACAARTRSTRDDP